MKLFLIRLLFSEKERDLMKQIFKAERHRIFDDKNVKSEWKERCNQIYKLEQKIFKP